MSGGGGYDLLTLLQEDLEDKEVRERLSAELEKIFVNQFDVKIDEKGVLHIDMTAYLRDVAFNEVETRDAIKTVFGTNNLDDLAKIVVNGK